MKYVVQPGDTLSKISQLFYGNPGYYNSILDANPQLGGKTAITVGQTLSIPGNMLDGPFLPGEASMLPPAPTQTMGPPVPSDLDTGGDPNSLPPAMNKATMIIFAGASMFLGYLIMKNLAKKGGPLAAANPRRKKNSRKKRPEDFQEMEFEDDEEEV